MAEALRPGAGGWYDDARSFLEPWGFTLAQITAPARLWFSRTDTNVPPAHAEYLAAHLEASHLEWLPDSGHLPTSGQMLDHLESLVSKL